MRVQALPNLTVNHLGCSHAWMQLVALAFVLGCAGCGWMPDTSDYGSVVYPAKNSSINGLGVFEKLCKQAGSRCIVANRLSSRLEKVDAIVLIGNTLHPPAKEARDWLEEWLAGQPGRSVVYVGRDFDADIYYRQKTLAEVPADIRQRAVFELTAAQMRLDTQLLSEIADDVFCRWFTLRIHQPQRDLRQFRGPWSEGLGEPSAGWPVRIVLEPPDPAQAANKPTWQPQAGTATTRAPWVAPQTKKAEEDEPVVFTSQWSQWDIGDDETWDSEWEKVPEFEVLLAGDDGTPLITRLVSERYPGSQILTLVNGAPLLNGTLVEPHFRKLAHKIIADLQPAKRIALLPYTKYGILVSRVDEADDEVAGLTVLTTWPMNIIVAHLAFLGILICLALFPILGRPQKQRSRGLADFGQHAESLGQMLQRTGDVHFALRAIADYYRTVRGEAMPSWVESALHATSPPASEAKPPSPPDTTAPAAAATVREQSSAPADPAPANPAPANPAPNQTAASGPRTASHILSRPPSGSHTDSSA